MSEDGVEGTEHTPGASLRRAMVDRYWLSSLYVSTPYFLLSGS